MTLESPIIVGAIILERWIEGHSYEDSLGRTYYSGAAEPSQADAEDCLAIPRVPPSPTATVGEIKAEAQRRIYAVAPAWKQANLIARVLELTRDHGTAVASWPTDAQTENAAAQVIWDAIKAIRAHSDALELDPPSVACLAAAGWPA